MFSVAKSLQHVSFLQLKRKQYGLFQNRKSDENTSVVRSTHFRRERLVLALGVSQRVTVDVVFGRRRVEFVAKSLVLRLQPLHLPRRNVHLQHARNPVSCQLATSRRS